MSDNKQHAIDATSCCCIDYFATLGKKTDKPFTFRNLRSIWGDDEGISPADALNDAITDIMVLTKDSTAPNETWTVLDSTIGDSSLELPHIAFRRRCDSKREDYITGIILVLPGEPVPPGYKIIPCPVQGLDHANILSRGFLYIKRCAMAADDADNKDPISFLTAESFIDDLCFFNRNANGIEEIPEYYEEIEIAGPSQAVRNSAQISLAMHRRDGVGVCDLQYDATTIDRYPQLDNKDYALPTDSLPLFAFPNGLSLSLRPSNECPLPIYYSYVFTDQDGRHFYVACLEFYEPITAEELQPVFEEVYGAATLPRGSSRSYCSSSSGATDDVFDDDGEEDSQSYWALRIPSDIKVYCPKVICVVSTKPFYRPMKQFLQQLYSLSFSALKCPLEFFIASVVNTVPLPIPSGRPFHVTLDVALISQKSISMAPILFQLPPEESFPFLDLDFSAVLRCLSVDHLLLIFTLMLREAKLLFLSESNAILTEVMEILRASLFPLNWSSCYVTRIPEQLLGLLQTPGGFMIGYHVSSSLRKRFHAGNDSLENMQRQQQEWSQQRTWGSNIKGSTAVREHLKRLHLGRSLIPGTYAIDLSANGVYQYDGKRFDTVTTKSIEKVLSLLPFGPKHRLRNTLIHICNDYDIGPQTNLTAEMYDDAFNLHNQQQLVQDADMSPDNSEDLSQKQSLIAKWENFPTVNMRDAFMSFMIDLLGDYPSYIIPPNEDLLTDTYRTFQEEFQIQLYIDHAERGTQSLMQLLLETQMFTALLQVRAEDVNSSRSKCIAYFERAGRLARQLDLCAGGHNWSPPAGGASAPPGILILPAPISSLLQADQQFSCLSMEQQRRMLDAAASLPPTRLSASAMAAIEDDGTSSFHETNGTHLTSRDLTYFNPQSGATLMNYYSNLSMVTISQRMENPRLDQLLTVVEFNDSTIAGDTSPPSGDVVSSSGHASSPSSSRKLLSRKSTVTALSDQELAALQLARSEIDCGQELQLDNCASGPLILPGPSAELYHSQLSDDEEEEEEGVIQISLDQNASQEEEKMEPAALESEKRSHRKEIGEDGAFSYKSGWPLLQHELFLEAQHAINPHVLEMKAELVRIQREVDPIYKALVRTDHDRFVFEHTGKLRSVLKGYDSTSIPSEEVISALSVMLSIVSLSITTLTLRSMHAPVTASAYSPAVDMLQIMGILAHVEQWGILPQIDESTWRSILLGCAWNGGDFMRRISCVLFECMNSSSIYADNLIFAAYLKALKSTKRNYNLLDIQSQRVLSPETASSSVPPSPIVHSKSASNENNHQNSVEVLIQPYLYLEEMGLTWYIQRSVLGSQARQMYEHRRLSRSNSSGAPSPAHSPVAHQKQKTSFAESTLNWARGKTPPRSTPHNSTAPDYLPGLHGKVAGLYQKERMTVTARTEALNLTTSQFNLQSEQGYLQFNRPIDHIAKWPSMHCLVNLNSSDDEQSSCNTESSFGMDVLFRVFQIHEDAKPVKMKTSSTSSKRSPSVRTVSMSSVASTVDQRNDSDQSSQQSRSFFSRFSFSKKKQTTTSPSVGAVAVSDLSSNENSSGWTTSMSRIASHVTGSAEKAFSSHDMNAIAAIDVPEDADSGNSRPVSMPLLRTEPTKASGRNEEKKRRANSAVLKMLSEQLKFEDDEEDGEEDGEDEEGGETGDQEEEEGEEQQRDELTNDYDPTTLNMPALSTDEHPKGDHISATDCGDEIDAEMATTNNSLDEKSKDIKEMSPNESHEDVENNQIEQPEDEIVVDTVPPPPPPRIPSSPDIAEISSPSQKHPSNRKIDIVELQHKITGLCIQKFHEKGVAIGIHSYTQCMCGMAVTDEELMSIWSNSTLYDSHVRGSSARSKRKARKMIAVHSITCRSCSEEIVPRLHVRGYDVLSTLDYTDKCEGDNQTLAVLWSEDIQQLSPMALQFELENILLQWGGGNALDLHWLKENQPVLLWGILWYTTRLNLPSGLSPSALSTPQETNVMQLLSSAPIVVGWRESVVRNQVQNLWGLQREGKSIEADHNRKIQQIFPSSSDEETQFIYQDVVQELQDASPASMRTAMLAFRKCVGAIHDLQPIAHNSNARIIYHGLLALCHLYQITQLISISRYSHVFHLKKETQFEKLYVETIKCALSPNDLTVLAATDAELLQACATTEELALRSALGYLL